MPFLKSIRQKLREQVTPERIEIAKRYLRRKAIQLAGKVFVSKFGKEPSMQRFTLRLMIDIEADGRKVIDDAMNGAGAQLYKYAPDALAFLNLNNGARFSGFRSDVTDIDSTGRDFRVQVDLFLEAANRESIQQPIDAVKDQASTYAPVVLNMLGLAGKVQFRDLKTEIVEGH